MLNESEQIIVLVVVALLLTLFLSSNMIKAIAQPFIEFKISVLRKYMMNFN